MQFLLLFEGNYLPIKLITAKTRQDENGALPIDPVFARFLPESGSFKSMNRRFGDSPGFIYYNLLIQCSLAFKILNYTQQVFNINTQLV